jgi:hypothetical protein
MHMHLVKPIQWFIVAFLCSYNQSQKQYLSLQWSSHPILSQKLL